jgi:putative endonuclease
VTQRTAIAERRLPGDAAEQLAARYLESQGLKLLARHVRCKASEIDLLRGDGKFLVVVEMRQRARRDFGGALGSVTAGRQRKIIRATRFVLRAFPRRRAHPLRFDGLAMQCPPNGVCGLEGLKDAFCA